MTNVYLKWAQLKNKHLTEGIELKYSPEPNRWQIFILESPDVFICYLPTQSTLNSPTFYATTTEKASLQADLDDFENNHKNDAEETSGVSD